MSKFAINDKVEVKKIDGTIHLDHLIGLQGVVLSTHDQWSHGSVICPHIMVDFGGVEQYRFYTNELEHV